MIVYTMTEEQIAAEVRRDFAEMSGKLRVAYNRFFTDARRYATYAQNSRAMNFPRKQTFTLRTKNNNTWNVYFEMRPDIQGVMGLIYLVIPFDNGHEYLIIKNFDVYLVERYTRHFIQRYEERHILPHHINTHGLPLPLHFVLTHYNKKFYRAEKYYGKELNIRENDTRSWFIMGDGMVVVEDKRAELKLWTFITYIDCSDLYDYQQKLLEEERARSLFERVKKVKTFTDTDPISRRRNLAICYQLISDPKTPYLIEAHLYRTTEASPQNMKKIIDAFWNLWKEFVNLTEHYNCKGKKDNLPDTYGWLLSQSIK